MFVEKISEFYISKCQFSTNKSRIKDNSHSNNLGRSEKEMEDEFKKFDDDEEEEDPFWGEGGFNDQ